ncbi:SMP-30/gluconolactonase/LRE family protein [Xanthomonas cassavae CFBP 4642]|uniref:SMP-30/gluconolactonase/LRE family protein n=1 Tax=Xanthomonas cassavae CFBP 4642 TaxID=1219375 RepID=A0ABS8HFP2_9XANT|nr:SMP-30/gluconolactonase/LRE family protein [Xanthomonas cassavae]MCC4621003.1 SMP-30/gluconolactonase/LRE family protein [Xanthomonas cassavae CFBP 4642]
MQAHCRVRAPGPAQPTHCAPPHAHDAALAARLGDARLYTLYDQATWSEGPAWWEAQRTLVWSDVVGRRVLGWREDGAVDVLLDATAFTNGNAVDAQQRLVHCEHGRRAITRSDAHGRAHLLVGRFEGKRLNSPNDLTVARDGALWFTDPPFGLLKPSQGCPGAQELDFHGVYRLPPNGGPLQCLARLDHPNGLAFSPDERVLYVSQTPEHGPGTPEITAFDWHDGALHDPRRFAVVPEGIADGFCVDDQGWLWSSSATGICIFDPAGRLLGQVPTPQIVSNCTFDPPQQRLFITGGGSLWMLQLQGK